MLAYPVRLERDESGLRAICRDLPEVLTWGDDEAEALANAVDAIEVVIGAAMSAGRDVPPPSPAEAGELTAMLPAALALKAEVYLAWRTSGLSKSELARRMGVAENEVRRILDPDHATKLATMVAAAGILGYQVSIDLRPAA